MSLQYFDGGSEEQAHNMTACQLHPAVFQGLGTKRSLSIHTGGCNSRHLL